MNIPERAELSAKFVLWPASAGEVNGEVVDDVVLRIEANADELTFIIGEALDLETTMPPTKLTVLNDTEFIDRMIEALTMARSIARKAGE